MDLVVVDRAGAQNSGPVFVRAQAVLRRLAPGILTRGSSQTTAEAPPNDTNRTAAKLPKQKADKLRRSNADQRYQRGTSLIATRRPRSGDVRPRAARAGRRRHDCDLAGPCRGTSGG